MTWITSAMGNIIREKLIDVSSVDFSDEDGFFIRSGAGDICYLPFGMEEGESVTKTVEAQVYFNDPVIAKKVYADGTTAADIYVGYGV